MTNHGFHKPVGPWKVSEGEAKGRTEDMEQEKLRLEREHLDREKREGTQKG